MVNYLSEEAYLDAIEEYGDEFEARMGAEAFKNCYVKLILKMKLQNLREELPTTNF